MSDNDNLDVLAIAAHRDDVEITCGGLLLKMATFGRQTGILDLTKGEMGTRGNENDREAEAATAAKILGLSYRKNLGFPDAALELSQANKLKIAEVIRITQPELVILPHWEQRHPDHRICSQLGFDACFLAGLSKLEVEGEPHRPRKIIYASYFRNAMYSFLVDISEQFETKCQAIAAYRSQFETGSTNDDGNNSDLLQTVDDLSSSSVKSIFQPGLTIYDLIHTRAKNLGQMVGVEYAEAYTVKESILIDDPQIMPVQSI